MSAVNSVKSGASMRAMMMAEYISNSKKTREYSHVHMRDVDDNFAAGLKELIFIHQYL